MRTLAVFLAAVPALGIAQQQVVKPPIAVYWVSAETAAGMSMPGMPAMAAGMMGGSGRSGGQSGRNLLLQLGSQQAASGEPKAEHDIPPGMNMGPMLPLMTPRREPAVRGEHVVKGNYSPEIKFALEKDFLDKVELAASGNSVRWNAIPNATGYFATVYGAQSENEIVFWSSSEVQEMGGALMDYLPPAEVARLVREKVVMEPRTVECTVPGEVVKKAGTPFLNFIAYGEEANFVQPPRPQDPKVPWEQRWTAKVRFKSTAALLLGERQERQSRQETRQDTTPTPAPQSQPAPDPVQEGIREGVNVLRGIFSR